MRRILLFLLLGLITPSAFSQNACGIINSYYSVVNLDTCTNSMTVSSKGLQKGDRVVIMQMNGASALLSNTNSFGTLNAINSAGNYEFNVVNDVIGDTQITFSLRLLNLYDLNSALQIIQFPAYRNVNTTCLLTCLPWNGKTGGVLVLYATDTIRIQSKIDVSGKGFRGSAPLNAGNCLPLPYTSYFTTSASNLAGRKGEGIFALTSAFECGRGKAINAGGGGNEHNSGGGGGANYGMGGDGGQRIKNIASCPGNYPGIGGESLATYYHNKAKNRIFMGASGGCGHENNNYSSISGEGGGIAFIIGKIIKCNNDSILSEGSKVTATCIEDGGSGGGAGGVIIMKTDSVYGGVFTSVRGGFGQSVNNSGKNECFGPGGGGGGGVITTSFKNKAFNIIFDTLGGNAGIVYNSTSACNNTSNYATNGANGCTLLNYIYNESPTVFRKFSISIGSDLILCKGDSVQLNANQGVSFEWTPVNSLSNPNSRNPKAAPDTTIIYFVKAFDGCSYAYDTVKVTVLPNPNVKHTADTSICYGDTLQLFVTGGIGYAWSPPIAINNTSIDSPKVWPSTNTYYVVKTSGTTCVKYDTIRIQVVPPPMVQAGNDTSLCEGDRMQLHANGAIRYQWSPNVNISDTTISDPFITAKNSITYSVTGFNLSGCYSKSNITISVNSCIDTLSSEILIPNVFTPNNDQVNDFFELEVKNISGFTVVVFNRWGQKIFESNDPLFKWGGDSYPDGIYFFKINYTNSDKKKVENKGPLTLIR